MQDEGDEDQWQIAVWHPPIVEDGTEVEPGKERTYPIELCKLSDSEKMLVPGAPSKDWSEAFEFIELNDENGEDQTKECKARRRTCQCPPRRHLSPFPLPHFPSPEQRSAGHHTDPGTQLDG